jgi:hypothetical protein
VRCTLAIVIVLSVACAAVAQATREAGIAEVSFDQRSPLSNLDAQHARYGVDRLPVEVYETARERFNLIVPENYAAHDAGWGLLVWCDAGDGGRLPREYVDLLAKKKLICVSARNAGNKRAVGVRIGLALDAVYNLRQRYPNLDDHRVYSAGVSGGGKVAEMAAMAFPDVFDGAIACAGANWYKDTPVPSQPGKMWQQTFRRPPVPQWVDAKEHVAFVFIAGEQDPNHEPVAAMVAQFKADKFKHVTFYEPAGLGHRPPPTDVFDKAIDVLDGTPKDRMKKQPATRRATPTTRR